MLVIALVVLLVLQFVAGNQPDPIERIKVSRNKVQAYGSRNQLAWEYTFREPSRDAPEGYLEKQENLARLIDLDADGSPEVLVTANVAGDALAGVLGRTVLHCFTARGELRWRYVPELTLSFAGRSFGGPWNINDVLVVPEGKAHSIWMAVAHHTWWLSLVVKLDATGKAELQFVNAGVLRVLGILRSSTGDHILAGGFNNEHDAGILAVLPKEKPAGSSPQNAGSPLQVRCLPAGAANSLLRLSSLRGEPGQTNSH